MARQEHQVTSLAVTDLPLRVPCLALNQPYAALLFGDEDGEVGPKSMESRLWEWPYPPGWLAIYATKNPDKAAYRRLATTIGLNYHHKFGGIIGIVHVDGCRPMTATDSEATCYPFDPSERQYVWPISRAYRYPDPDRTKLTRGPQKFVYVNRSSIAQALCL